jgi:hypothetical protein
MSPCDVCGDEYLHLVRGADKYLNLVPDVDDDSIWVFVAAGDSTHCVPREAGFFV